MSEPDAGRAPRHGVIIVDLDCKRCDGTGRETLPSAERDALCRCARVAPIYFTGTSTFVDESDVRPDGSDARRR